MRNKKAKQIRKMVYGDFAHSVRVWIYVGKKRATRKDNGRRIKYQAMKKFYKKGVSV